MLLTNTFERILLCFFFKDFVDSVFFLLICLRKLCIFLWFFFYKFYFLRHAIIFFIISKSLFIKDCFLHFVYIFKCIYLFILSIIVIFIYLFFNLFNRLVNKDIFFLLIFDFVETFFVKKNVCNTLNYLRLKFPILSCFIYIVFHKFFFFKCFKFFYLHVTHEQKRQKALKFTIKKISVRVDAIRKMLFKCAYGGWAKYYDTFSETRSEIDIFDFVISQYMVANRLENKALRYLFLRRLWPHMYPVARLIELKKTMSLILFISHKRKYCNDDY